MGKTLVWWTLLLGACGGEDSPVEKCDVLVDTICERAIGCEPRLGSFAECVQVLQGEIPCGTVKAVSASYDRCMDQLESFSCSVLFPVDPQTGQPALRLPADCNSVVLY